MGIFSPDTMGYIGLLIGGAVFLFAPQISGWTQLADLYPDRQNLNSDWEKWQGGKIGCYKYTGLLWIQAKPEGLYLRVAPFMPGHTPLLIPWSAIESQKPALFNMTCLKLRGTNVAVRLPARFLQKSELTGTLPSAPPNKW